MKNLDEPSSPESNATSSDNIFMDSQNPHQFNHGSNVAFANILGQGRVNQLGGVFINGRPLPHHIRVKIIEMAQAGVRPCMISRQLRVSHGCVSKILYRFAETGTISPGQVGGSRPKGPASLRISPPNGGQIQNLTSIIADYRRQRSELSADDIRNLLVADGHFLPSEVPSSAKIDIILRGNELANGTPSPPEVSTSSHSKPNAHRFSVHAILGLDAAAATKPEAPSTIPANEQPSSSTLSTGDVSQTDVETPLAQNGGKRRNRTSFSQKQQDALESAFNRDRYPDVATRERLSKCTQLSEQKIQVWFSNRRARWRKQCGLNAGALFGGHQQHAGAGGGNHVGLGANCNPTSTSQQLLPSFIQSQVNSSALRQTAPMAPFPGTRAMASVDGARHLNCTVTAAQQQQAAINHQEMMPPQNPALPIHYNNILFSMMSNMSSAIVASAYNHSQTSPTRVGNGQLAFGNDGQNVLNAADNNNGILWKDLVVNGPVDGAHAHLGETNWTMAPHTPVDIDTKCQLVPIPIQSLLTNRRMTFKCKSVESCCK